LLRNESAGECGSGGAEASGALGTGAPPARPAQAPV
jgi:hypothetical protein